MRKIGALPHSETATLKCGRVTTSSMDSNGASQPASDYVLSTDSTRRILASIRSTSDNASIASDMPYNPFISRFISRSTNDDDDDDDALRPDNRPIFKLDALCVQAILYPITLVIYLLIGAAVFSAIEHEQEVMARREAEDEIKRVISKVSGMYNLSENTTEKIFNDFTSLCTNNHLQIRNASFQWTFLPSFYFAATVITAIGFGHASPSGKLGRAFLCIYALMGIPLLLVGLVTIGKYFSGVWDAVLSRVSCKRFVVSKNRDIYSTGLLLVLGLLGVVFIPASIFQRIEEKWSYEDSVYFAIVTLTTIGFGDITPDPRHLTQFQYILLYLTWLFVGLAVVSILVTRLSEIYTRVNKSIIVLSKRCFNMCLRYKKDYLVTNEDNELNTI